MSEQRAVRIAQLTGALEGVGVIHLRDAAQLLGVSEMTVRRDIAAAPGAVSYLGGYIVPRTAESGYVLAREQTANASAKAAICRRAATMIENDDAIFIDCGTTMTYLARSIPPGLRITVVCYALNIAMLLAPNPNIRLILLGGVYSPSSASFDVHDGLAALSRLGINKAFISAGGVHASRGVSCSNFHEASVKQAVIRTAVERCLLADAGKIGRVKPVYFAELAAFDTFITSPAPDNLSPEAAAFQGRLIVA
jgi:DeoR family transcriptional regulator, deoxyribose operon repressor